MADRYESIYTGQEVDERLGKVNDLQQDVAELEQAVQNLTPADPDPEGEIYESQFDGAEIDRRLARLGELEATVERVEQEVENKYTFPDGGIPVEDLDEGVQESLDKADTAVQPSALDDYYTKPETEALIPDVSQFITKSVNDLVNYYLKSETYSKTQVDNLLAAIRQFTYELVDTLPTASADTMGKIYLVPSSDPALANIKDEYITIDYGPAPRPYGLPRYDWEQIGSTAIDLSGYVTTSDLQTALADYTTTANLTTMLEGKQDVINDLSNIRSGAEKGATAYQLPVDGIPASDLAAGVIPTVPVQDVTLDGTSVLDGTTAKLPAYPKSPRIFMGTCSTAAATVAKEATVEAFPLDANNKPLVGTVVGIKFTNTNSATAPTLNVNSTGAASIYYNSAVYEGKGAYGGSASRYIYYVWDGTYWVFQGWSYDADADTNTVGYNLRTNMATPPVSAKTYRYRILFTSPDHLKTIPSNTSSSTNATSARTVNQAKIDPFGPIWYYSTTTAIEANAGIGASYAWLQYSAITLGYSFNRTGAALTLTTKSPVFVKCAPQSDGTAIIDADNPIVQALPSTADGKIYIFLGVAESATTITMYYYHPVYHYADGQIRLWTNAAASVTVDQTYDATSANAQSGVAMAGALAGKQDTISDLSDIRQGSENNVKYVEQSLTDAQKAQARDNAGAQGLHEGATSGVTNPKEGDICVEPNWQSISPTYTGASTASFTYRVYDVHSYTGSLRITAFSEYGWWIDRGSTAHLLDDTPIIIPAGEAASIRIEASLGETPSLTIEEQQGTTNNKEYYNGAWRDRAYELSTNKVTSISSSSTDTQYPSAKAVYDEVHPAVQTTQPQGGFLPNVEYNLGTLTGAVTFSLASAVSGIANHYFWTFETASTAPTITWPNGISWNGGSAPTINSDKHYEISILNGYGAFMEV